ncbi:hypothetical protein AJ80_04341 [Polytolypa hystricis UAMH7299]|uniref:Uncharacterized protein n=1 Tax=Polytolypa hystricis (strain UAMH7299) TaxID=1447883 RepID=A0A2B7YCY4_POLH7|nr:hypothetical protein AJ80_04341 [Polytolypa hystricis UAMH7299]
MAQPQQYWLPGYGLSRHVVLSQIQFFLGPSASARPYTYQGREGYLIMGSPLTREQISDLAHLSKEYEREASMRMTQSSQSYNSPSGKSPEPFINELVPVGQRSRGGDRERERGRDRERERDRKPAHNNDRRSRHQRAW